MTSIEYIKKYYFNIDPIGKPRMTRADAWKKRDCVLNYWSFKDELNKQADKQKYKVNETLNILFCLSMPPSWSKKMKEKMNGAPHQNKPDIDNLVKAFLDCLCKNDSFVHTINASKIWSDTGLIIVGD